jgi:translocation and assembly module TamB
VTEPATRPPRWWKFLLVVIAVGVVALLAALWYSTTDSFQAYVRKRVVAEVERITGGRAEVGTFHVVPFHMQVEVRNITVHGKEGPKEIPLAHADSLVAHLKVISFLRTEFGFSSVTLEHPVVHIAIAPDGTTNVPAVKVVRRPSENTPIEQLFSLSIDHLTVRKGELLWADKKIPLNFAAHDTALQMDYSFLHRRYESHLMVGKVDSVVEDLRPFAWMTTADFSLAANFVDIRSMRWNSGRSSFAASGRVSDFRNPRLDASYEAHVDFAEAAAIARRRDLREGSADFKGSGHWSLEQFTSSGTVELQDVGWQNNQIALKRASATSDYSVSDDQVKLSKLQGKLFGGSFSGDAQVDNWLHSVPLPPAGRGKKGGEEIAVITAARPPARKGEKPKLPGVQSGVVHLRLRDFSAGETAVALDVPAHPLHRFRPAGLANGTVDAFWKGSAKDAEIAFTADVNPPPHSAAGELPVTAHAQGKYRGVSDSLELAQFNVSTPASRVQASGILAATSTLHFSVSTSNLEEWRPLVTALGGPTNLPFRVDGSATFNGVAEGTFSEPTVAGTLVAQDFEFTLPATSRTAEQPVHWDSLAASFQFSSHDLALRGGSLRRGDTSADFEVSAVLQQGQFTENSP